MKRLLTALAVGMTVGSALAAEPTYETLICHRGESVDAPENTLPAYQMAVDRGFGFECDIYLSKDEKCFTFHDGDLKRTTDGASTNKCHDASWADELSTLDVGGWGKWKGSAYEGTRPALLEEVLALAQDGRWIYVEIKEGPQIVPFVKKVFEAQKKATPSNTLFICFNDKVCAELKKEMPDYRVYWLTVDRRKNAEGKWSPISAAEVIAVAKRCRADGIDIRFNADIHTADYIRAVHAAGLGFHVWTVDRPLKTLLAFARGADTVTTNCAKAQLEEIAREVK